MKQVLLRLVILSSLFAVVTAQAQIGPPPPPPSWPPDTAEVTLNSSCLAGNGRVDVNINNRSTAVSVYRLEFEGLSARERTIQFEDWGRIRLTGRPPGDYSAIVRRDGEVVLNTVVTINCSASTPPVSSPEVTMINACRGGNGQVFFQFVNPTASSRPYIIEFDNVPNRSTTAAPFGQALRGTTGRPDGTYGYLVRSSGSVVDSGFITVDCD